MFLRGTPMGYIKLCVINFCTAPQRLHTILVQSVPAIGYEKPNGDMKKFLRLCFLKLQAQKHLETHYRIAKVEVYLMVSHNLPPKETVSDRSTQASLLNTRQLSSSVRLLMMSSRDPPKIYFTSF